MTPELVDLVARYKRDPESVYNTWFVNNEARMKAFRSVRRGVQAVVASIRDGTFGNDFKGSPLELVLACITEQKQVFKGAAHAFYWKPKLRIPDIYEDEQNQQVFGQFLQTCLSVSAEEKLVREIVRLDRHGIKGLGPAVANILYFLHPTLVPPFNTAMVRGFNALFGARNTLGSWVSYLDMREVLLRANDALKPALSKDVGALSGLLFDVGVGKIGLDATWESSLHFEAKKLSQTLKHRHEEVAAEIREESEHLRVQFLLTEIGKELGYDVFVAVNDRTRSLDGRTLEAQTIAQLPALGVSPEVLKTISLIDVLWLDRDTHRIVCAFEVEKSTSIYSGLLRLVDLASSQGASPYQLYLVAPDAREKEILAQVRRPSFRMLDSFSLRYILFSDLYDHCRGLCKFGDDHRILLKLAKDPCPCA